MEVAKEVKKPVEAIQCTNAFNLLQRKMYNVLLANAAGNLRADYTHRIQIGILCKLMGYNSRDYDTIKDRFRELRRLDIEWDIINEKGHKVWTNTSPLSLARVIEGEGVCEYEFTKSLIPYLDHPAQYAKFSLTVQSKFRSGYGLVLFENCERYKNINQTCAYEISIFRKLMGLKEDEYKEFSDLKRRVINPAVNETSMYADYVVSPVYEKIGRKTVKVRFILTPKKLGHSNVPALDLDQSKLLETLENIFCLTENEIEKLLKKFDVEYVREKIEYIFSSKSFQAGEIRNLAGYLKDALNSDYKPAKSSKEIISKLKMQEYEKKLKEEQINKELTKIKSKYSKYQTELVLDKILSLDFETKNKFEIDFENYLKEKNDEIAYISFKRKGLQWKGISYYLKEFIYSQYPQIADGLLTIEAFIENINPNLLMYFKFKV